ncbi:MAG: hypothetical protein KAJ03_01570, partial [Gammaproteobacteria bacterium]|nr:hypothetical protein [Gammaproteobacteria bacterium]
MVLIVLPSIGEGREWYAEPSVNIRSVYDDNIQLRTNDKFVEEEYGVIASALSRFGVRSEIMDISTEAQVDVKRYSNNDDLDTENFYFDLDSTFNVSERNRFNLDGRFVMDTSLTSELEDTGLTQVQVDRELKEITPGWTYLLSETQTIEASYTHNDVEYEDVSFSDLTDYRVDSVSLGYS